MPAYGIMNVPITRPVKRAKRISQPKCNTHARLWYNECANNKARQMSKMNKHRGDHTKIIKYIFQRGDHIKINK